MEFFELEKLAYIESEMPNKLTQSEQLCFLSLRNLYKDFREGFCNEKQASREKYYIKKAYEKQAEIDSHALQMNARTSECIRESERVRSNIIKSLDDGAPLREILAKALGCIAYMSNDSVFATKAMEAAERINNAPI